MRPDRLVRDLFRTRVLVTLSDGSAFSGLLMDADRRSLLLREVEAMTGDKTTPADGQLLIPRERVAYLQLP